VIRSNVSKHGILPHIRRRRPQAGIQGGLFHLFTQKSIQLCYEGIGIRAMHLASIRDGFASRMGAAKAMHSDLKEKLCGLYVEIQNVANQGFLRYFHFSILSFFAFLRFIVPQIEKLCQDIF
jgi:hypothetical protein